MYLYLICGLRLGHTGEEQIITRLELISKAEGLNISPETLKTLVSATGGDMRRAITSLQSCSRLKGKNSQLEPDDVLEVMGVSIFPLYNCDVGFYTSLVPTSAPKRSELLDTVAKSSGAVAKRGTNIIATLCYLRNIV